MARSEHVWCKKNDGTKNYEKIKIPHERKKIPMKKCFVYRAKPSSWAYVHNIIYMNFWRGGVSTAGRVYFYCFL